MRIGGEFELYPASFAGAGKADAPWPCPEMPSGIWVDLGRSALFLAAKTAIARGCRRVHLPAYLCHSVVEPLEKAGLAIRFYAGLPFAPIRLPPLGPEDAFLFVHYFGADCEPGRVAASEARAKGAFVIEDRVQAGLSTGIPLLGDVVITSLRKLIGAPDGAFFGYREAAIAPLLPPDERSVSLRILGKIMRGAGMEAGHFLPLLEEAEEGLQADTPRMPSHASARIIAATDFAEVAARRRQNWFLLHGALAPLIQKNHLSPIMPALKPGEVPLGYPILLRELAGGPTAPALREKLRHFLKAREIFCPVHWPLGHLDRYAPEITASFSAERIFAQTMLTLPIDQRYEAAQMQHLHECIAEFFHDSV